MRIIAGTYRGRVIKSPPDKNTRPTSDRLRETLFNILSSQIDSETRFLDLCAGTGAVGIEAISRGAGFAAFVDKSRRACGLIEENLDILEIPNSKTEVVCDSAVHYLNRLHGTAWDLIFYDPPYEEDYTPVLNIFGSSSSKLLKADSTLVVEHLFKNKLPELFGSIERTRTLKQGDSCLSFFQQS